MTAFTILAETTIVNIVPCMTIITGARQANLFHGLGMALGTLQSPVFASQRKAGLTTVIETPFLPTAGTVTGFTFNTQSSPMVVVLSVTTYAGNRCIPECFGLVARFALHLCMPAQQRKCSQPVIEYGAFPGPLRVTIFTLLPFLPLVYVVRSMAGIAGLAQLLVPQYTLVAGCALDAVVLATKRESAFLQMIEGGSRPAVGGVTAIALDAKLALVALTIIVPLMARITF